MPDLDKISEFINSTGVFLEGHSVGEAALAKKVIGIIEDYANQDEPATRLTAARDSIYVYQHKKGTWKEVDETTCLAIIQLLDGKIVKSKDKKGDDVTKALSLSFGRMRGIYKCMTTNGEILMSSFFDTKKAGIAFTNGFAVVDENGVTLEPHSPENRCLQCLPYDYDAEANPGQWIDVIRNVFQDDKDRKAKMDVIQEFAGACVAGIATDYQRCMVFLGSGSNGKSTIAEAITDQLFDKEHISHVAPQNWEQEYNLSAMAGSRINMVSEIPASDIMASDKFKTVISGDPMQARDPYRKPYSFRPIAGHLFSCNELPGTIDTSHGFWRRFIVVTFNRVFDQKVDKKLKSKIVNKMRENRDGIMVWALQGASRLIKNGDYKLPPSHGDSLMEWQADTSPVSAFVQSCCKVTGERTKLSEIYSEYCEWAEKQGRRRTTNRTLAGKLVSAGVKKHRGSCGMEFDLVVKDKMQWIDW